MVDPFSIFYVVYAYYDSNCSLCVLDSVSNNSYHVIDHFQSIDIATSSQQNQSYSLLLTKSSVLNKSSNAVPIRKRSATSDRSLLSERTLTSEQYLLLLNLTERQMPSCIIKDIPPDYLRRKIKWGNAVEIEKADNMIKQLALEEKEYRCRSTSIFKNNTLSSISIGPSKNENAN